MDDVYKTKFPQIYEVFSADPNTEFIFDFYLLQTFSELVDDIIQKYNDNIEELKNSNDDEEYNNVLNILKTWDALSFSYKFNITINALICFRSQGFYPTIINNTLH